MFLVKLNATSKKMLLTFNLTNLQLRRIGLREHIPINDFHHAVF